MQLLFGGSSSSATAREQSKLQIASWLASAVSCSQLTSPLHLFLHLFFCRRLLFTSHVVRTHCLLLLLSNSCAPGCCSDLAVQCQYLFSLTHVVDWIHELDCGLDNGLRFGPRDPLPVCQSQHLKLLLKCRLDPCSSGVAVGVAQFCNSSTTSPESIWGRYLLPVRSSSVQPQKSMQLYMSSEISQDCGIQSQKLTSLMQWKTPKDIIHILMHIISCSVSSLGLR